MLTPTAGLFVHLFALYSPEEPEQFHYRLSREQEDDIRACFLVDRLRSYTKVRTYCRGIRVNISLSGLFGWLVGLA